MIVSLDVIGASTELFAGIVVALARHNEVWWRRERAARREPPPGWWQRLRYEPPPASGLPRLRDVATLLAAGVGGCGELAAAYAGWVWSLDNAADLETLRVSDRIWHSRVIRRAHNNTRVIWDPERTVAHAA